MKKVVLITSVSLFILLAGCANTQNIARCLTDKGVRMYGAYWCGACAQQKDAFGDSFKYVDYTECAVPGSNTLTQPCIDAGVESFPTWVFPDGEKITGVRTPTALAERVGCET